MPWLQVGGVPGYHVVPEAPPDNWMRELARTYATAVGGTVVDERFDADSGALALKHQVRNFD